MKPCNVLISGDGKIKIADFGLARTFNVKAKTLTHEVVTLWYRAPEVLLGAKVYSLPVDIWSVGCIFFEMIHGVPFMKGDSEIDQIFKIFNLHGTPTEETWPGVTEYDFWKESYPKFPAHSLAERAPKLKGDGLDLLSKMTAMLPSDRITAKDAMNHPYFDDLDKSAFCKVNEEVLPNME